jgi:tungstate transport system ATP-binding protein
MLSLHARNLSHSYRGRAVLRDITLEISPETRLSLIGPNGAGKSTLLRLLAGLEKPTQGEAIARDGETPVTDPLALRRRVTMLLQRPYLLQTTVLGNVLYGLHLRGHRAGARQKALSVLEATGLAHKANQHARTLSGGEAQLLNLARALALEPEILLLDEVTAHLDPENEARIEQLVLDFSRTPGRTLIIVTQDLPQACRLAPEGLLLYDGQLAGRGPLPDLLRHPSDPRVARFLQSHTLRLDS